MGDLEIVGQGPDPEVEAQRRLAAREQQPLSELIADTDDRLRRLAQGSHGVPVGVPPDTWAKLKIDVFVEEICRHLGIYEVAERRRALLAAEMVDNLEAQATRAMLSGAGAPPPMNGHPNRQQRRHPGAS